MGESCIVCIYSAGKELVKPAAYFLTIETVLLFRKPSFFTAADDIGNGLYFAVITNTLLSKENPVGHQPIVFAVRVVDK